MKSRPAIFFLLALLVVAAALLATRPAFSTLPEFTAANGNPQADHWDFSASGFRVTWNLNPAHGGNITGSRSVDDVITAAFNTWLAAPNANIAVSRGPDVGINTESSSPSNINLICFVCTDADFSKDSQTLAVSITTTSDVAGQSNGHGGTTTFVGQIIKADILFNPSTAFTTGGSTGQDLQTVATHEIGHFLGLDHTGVVRAVMFPAASSIEQLSFDDVAGLAALYPKMSPDVVTGTISGSVRMAGGGPVFGAHVFAESTTGNNPFGSSIRESPISTLTRPDGTFAILGVPADSYVVTAEPLDGPVSNGDVSGYSKAFGQPSVQTNFTTRWH